MVTKAHLLRHPNSFKFYSLSSACVHVQGGFEIAGARHNMIRLLNMLERFFR